MPEITEQEKTLRAEVEALRENIVKEQAAIKEKEQEVKTLFQERCSHSRAFILDGPTMHCPDCEKRWDDPQGGTSMPI